MKNITVAITLSGINSEILDDTTGKIVRSMNTEELKDLYVMALPSVEGVLKRKITLVSPTEKNIAILSKIVIPKTVNITIVNS